MWCLAGRQGGMEYRKGKTEMEVPSRPQQPSGLLVLVRCLSPARDHLAGTLRVDEVDEGKRRSPTHMSNKKIRPRKENEILTRDGKEGEISELRQEKQEKMKKPGKRQCFNMIGVLIRRSTRRRTRRVGCDRASQGVKQASSDWLQPTTCFRFGQGLGIRLPGRRHS